MIERAKAISIKVQIICLLWFVQLIWPNRNLPFACCSICWSNQFNCLKLIFYVFLLTFYVASWSVACQHCHIVKADTIAWIIEDEQAKRLSNAVSKESLDVMPFMVLQCEQCKVIFTIACFTLFIHFCLSTFCEFMNAFSC